MKKSELQLKKSTNSHPPSLRREKVLLKLNTGQDDHAIIFIDLVMKRMEAKKLGHLAVFEWFKTHVIVMRLEPSIDHQELTLWLNKWRKCADDANLSFDIFLIHFHRIAEIVLLKLEIVYQILGVSKCSLLSFGEEVKDEHVSLLINSGLLDQVGCELGSDKDSEVEGNIYPNATPTPVFANLLIQTCTGLQSKYWFHTEGPPSETCLLLIKLCINEELRGFDKGRKELLSLLSYRKYKEMMMVLLEKKRLWLSPLDMRFHLRDLISSGRLKIVHTPTGLVVR
ncbi:Serine-threonine protein kinase 19, partial [Dillenia turbinata]